jgi:hypothetical protein
MANSRPKSEPSPRARELSRQANRPGAASGPCPGGGDHAVATTVVNGRVTERFCVKE